MSNIYFIEDDGSIYEVDSAGSSTLVFSAGPDLYSTDYNSSSQYDIFGSYAGNLVYPTNNTTSGAVEFCVVDADTWTHTLKTIDAPWPGDTMIEGGFIDGAFVYYDNTVGDIFCVDLATEAIRWSISGNRTQTDGVSGIYSAFTYGSGVSKVDPADGSEVWSNLSPLYYYPRGKAGASGVSFGRHTDEVIHLDADTGAQMWVSPAHETSRWATGGGRVITGYGAEGGVFDTADGSEVYPVRYHSTAPSYPGTVRRLYADEGVLITIGAWGEIASYDPDAPSQLWSLNADARYVTVLRTAEAPPEIEADSTVEGISSIPPVEAAAGVAPKAMTDSTVSGIAEIAPVEASSGVAVSAQGTSVSAVAEIQPVEATADVAPRIFVSDEGPTDFFTTTEVQILALGGVPREKVYFVAKDTGQADFLSTLSAPFAPYDGIPSADDELLYGEIDTGNLERRVAKALLLTGETQALFSQHLTQQEYDDGWRFEGGYALSDGFLLSRVEQGAPTRYYIERTDRDGEQLWTREIPSRVMAYSEDDIYVYEGSPVNAATRISAATGSTITTAAVEPPAGSWPNNALAHGIHLYLGQGFGSGTAYDNYITKYDSNLSVVWRTGVGDDWSAPLVVGVDDARVYVRRFEIFGGDQRVEAYSTTTGAHLWTSPVFTDAEVAYTKASRDDILMAGGTRIDKIDGSSLWQSSGIVRPTGVSERSKAYGYYPLQVSEINSSLFDSSPHVIDGIVRDGDGNRAQGVTVAALGAQGVGATTDVNGRFQLDIGEGQTESLVLGFTYSGANSWNLSLSVKRNAPPE
jgi:hypothetical protein